MKLGMACGVWLMLVCQLSAQSTSAIEYLVLKNGAVLTGQVTQEGQVYILRSPGSTGESRYPSSMIAKWCANTTELYQFFQQAIRPDDVGDHCRLATLCMKHGLMTEAKTEIDAALKMDRRSSEAIALQQQWTTRQNTPKVTVEPPALPASAVLPLTPALLEDWPQAMTPAAFQDFSVRIQPLLNTGCGTGACHGVSEGKRAFILKKSPVGVQPSPFMSKTNLERVLGLIEKDKPETSELLKRALHPHGSVKYWPINTDQQRILTQWVNTMAGKAELAKVETPAPFQSGESKPSTGTFASGNSNGVPPVEAARELQAPCGKLPSIPGMSGSAVQQTGGAAPSIPPVEPATQTANPPSKDSPGGLPAIPGVSGKAQNGLGNKPPPGKPDTPTPPRTQVNPKETPEYWQYAQRLGYAQPIQDQKQDTPQQLRLLNAGSYRVEEPPVPQELRDPLRRQQELAKKVSSKDKEKDNPGSSPAFLRSGTIVNQPPK